MNVKRFGEGEVLKLDSGERIFKLDSYEENPIVEPKELGLICYENGKLQPGAVFNPGAEFFSSKIILTPRFHTNYRKRRFVDRDSEGYISEICPLISEDGICFQRVNDSVIKGDGTNHEDFIYGIEDVRIIKLREKYLLIGVGKITPPFIANGKVYITMRFPPEPGFYLDSLDKGMEQLLDPSAHKIEWRNLYERRCKNKLMDRADLHESVKIGPGTQLIETKEGWLMIYHAVGGISPEISKAYGFKGGINKAYSVCTALLNQENPRRLLCRTKKPIYIPSKPYELYGNELYPVDVPAVVFPVGAVVIKDKLLVYCGAGDKYVILLSCNLNNLVDYLLEECSLRDGK